MQVRQEASFNEGSLLSPAPLLPENNNDEEINNFNSEPNSTTAMNMTPNPNPNTNTNTNNPNNTNSPNTNAATNTANNNANGDGLYGRIRAGLQRLVATNTWVQTQDQDDGSSTSRSQSIAQDPRLLNDPFIHGPMVITQASGSFY